MTCLYCEDEVCGNSYESSRLGSDFVTDGGGHRIHIDEFKSKDSSDLICPDCGKRLLTEDELNEDCTETDNCPCEDCRNNGAKGIYFEGEKMD